MRRVFSSFLLGLLTEIMADIFPYSPLYIYPQYEPVGRWYPKFGTSGMIVGRHHNEEHLENVGPKSFGRFFDDSKKCLDKIEDKIVRRNLSLYGSRRSLAEERLISEKEYAAVREALALQKEGFDSHLKYRPGYLTSLENQVFDQRQQYRRSLGSTNRKDCAMKVLDLDGDVCGFVDQLVQLNKLLKRRNLLLRYMAESKINTEGAAPQALTLFVSGMIRDVITSNTKMKSLLDKNKRIKENEDLQRRSQDNTRVTEITETSTVNFTNSINLTNEPANRLYDNNFSSSSRNNINETVEATEDTIINDHSTSTEYSLVSEISQQINSTDLTTSSA